MTNNYIYFVANWKMFGGIKSLNSLGKVIKFSKLSKKFKFKLIYCPPYTLLSPFIKKIKKSQISLGAQNCHYISDSGAYTGSISPEMLKSLGVKYVILGHSESRSDGDTDYIINRKVRSCNKKKLKIIFCIGETLKEKRNGLTHKVLKKQISKGLEGVKNINNILFAYEPVWSIGTGVIPKLPTLRNDINILKSFISKKFKKKNIKILYGGSVNSNNIKDLKDISTLDGFLVGGASQNAKKFIDIVRKTFN